jgi:hypothetical protein
MIAGGRTNTGWIGAKQAASGLDRWGREGRAVIFVVVTLIGIVAAVVLTKSLG